MKCPACGVENPDDKDFCGDCGTRLPEPEPQPAPEPAAPVPPPAYVPPAPTQPMSPPAAVYTPPTQPQPGQVYAAQQPAYTPPPTPVPAGPKKKITGPVIAIVAGVLLLCALGCCGAAFLFLPEDQEDPPEVTEENIIVEEESDRGKIEISREKGFDSAMDALEDIAEQYYQGEDWWYLTIVEEDDFLEYYITPDETSYDKGVIVEEREGEWFVTDIYTVDMSQVDPPAEEPREEDITPEEYAAWTVHTMLVAIMEGRMEDAYAMTAQPLSDYDLSALSGEYTNWEFLGAEEQDDGTVVVVLTMYWSDDTYNNVGALCIWGDTDMYVSDMASVDE